MDMKLESRDNEVLGLRFLRVTNSGTVALPKSLMAPGGPTWVKAVLARVSYRRPHLSP